MEKYIPLSVVESEIERRIKHFKEQSKKKITTDDIFCVRALNDLLSAIRTVETKNVDFETLLKEYGINDDPFSNKVDNSNGARIIAKHFYDQGIMARVNEEYVEDIISHLDSIRETADKMTTGNFMHNRAAIRFSANTIENVLRLIGIKRRKEE